MSSIVRDYEFVVVINPEIGDDELPNVVEKLSRFITEKGGTVDEVEQWGRKKLAYPIGKFMEGNYILSRFKLEPKLIRDFEADLRISDEILRHLVVKVGS